LYQKIEPTIYPLPSFKTTAIEKKVVNDVPFQALVKDKQHHSTVIEKWLFFKTNLLSRRKSRG
jgi:hypothetical protein